MWNKRLIMGLCFIIFLSGCSDSSDLSDDFINALNSNDEICYDIGIRIFGIDIFKQKGGDLYLFNQDPRANKAAEGDMMISKLLKNGYVGGEPIVINVTNYSIETNGYKLTAKGHKHFGKRVCIANRMVTDIIQYTEPAENSGMTFSAVEFMYDFKLKEFVHDFDLKQMLYEVTSNFVDDLSNYSKTENRGKALLVKTNKGWKLERAEF